MNTLALSYLLTSKSLSKNKVNKPNLNKKTKSKALIENLNIEKTKFNISSEAFHSQVSKEMINKSIDIGIKHSNNIKSLCFNNVVSPKIKKNNIVYGSSTSYDIKTNLINNFKQVSTDNGNNLEYEANIVESKQKKKEIKEKILLESKNLIEKMKVSKQKDIIIFNNNIQLASTSNKTIGFLSRSIPEINTSSVIEPQNNQSNGLIQSQIKVIKKSSNNTSISSLLIKTNTPNLVSNQNNNSSLYNSKMPNQKSNTTLQTSLMNFDPTNQTKLKKNTTINASLSAQKTFNDNFQFKRMRKENKHSSNDIQSVNFLNIDLEEDYLKTTTKNQNMNYEDNLMNEMKSLINNNQEAYMTKKEKGKLNVKQIIRDYFKSLLNQCIDNLILEGNNQNTIKATENQINLIQERLIVFEENMINLATHETNLINYNLFISQANNRLQMNSQFLQSSEILNNIDLKFQIKLDNEIKKIKEKGTFEEILTLENKRSLEKREKLYTNSLESSILMGKNFFSNFVDLKYAYLCINKLEVNKIKFDLPKKIKLINLSHPYKIEKVSSNEIIKYFNNNVIHIIKKDTEEINFNSEFEVIYFSNGNKTQKDLITNEVMILNNKNNHLEYIQNNHRIYVNYNDYIIEYYLCNKKIFQK